ncbi:hypothetical protein J6590_007973 [Homalodisca vitripennis]|nr:hypothetical protein J6590_007973 [Homalodisca vitripennis]
MTANGFCSGAARLGTARRLVTAIRIAGRDAQNKQSRSTAVHAGFIETINNSLFVVYRRQDITTQLWDKAAAQSSATH